MTATLTLDEELAQARRAVVDARDHMDAQRYGSAPWFVAERRFNQALSNLRRIDYAVNVKPNVPKVCPHCQGAVEPAYGQCLRQCQRAPRIWTGD
jgi:hypothetical protein